MDKVGMGLIWGDVPHWANSGCGYGCGDGYGYGWFLGERLRTEADSFFEIVLSQGATSSSNALSGRAELCFMWLIVYHKIIKPNIIMLVKASSTLYFFKYNLFTLL